MGCRAAVARGSYTDGTVRHFEGEAGAEREREVRLPRCTGAALPPSMFAFSHTRPLNTYLLAGVGASAIRMLCCRICLEPLPMTVDHPGLPLAWGVGFAWWAVGNSRRQEWFFSHSTSSKSRSGPDGRLASRAPDRRSRRHRDLRRLIALP